MTSAYNKRPRARGKVRENSKNTAAFIEWVQPKNSAAKIMLTVMGIIPLVILAIFDWVRIDGEYLGVEEAVTLSKLSMFTSINELAATISQIAFPLPVDPTDAQLAAVAGFELWFSGFKFIFVIAAAMLVISMMFLVVSIIACQSNARVPFAFLGFGVATASPLVFYYAASTVNRMAEAPVLELTLFPYLALLAGLIAMVYCVRFPVASDAKGKRSSTFTRIVTTFVPVKGDGLIEGVRKVIFTTALVSFVYFGSTLGVDMFNEWRAGRMQRVQENMINPNADINDPAFGEITRIATPLPDYLEVWRENNDMVGWIRVGDRINYSVLQTDNNDYYLDNCFEHKPSKGGWIFADFRNRFNGFEISDNTILYGHNISTGAYFAALTNYYRRTVDGTLSFYRDNPVIEFDTLYEKAEWKVFACVLMNTQPEFGDVMRYWETHEFETADEFNDYILNVMDRSVLFTDVDLEFGDKLLTLSTCYWPFGTDVDTRCVVFARRVRPGESSEVNVDKATWNRQVLRFTKEAQIMGQTWPGHRVWDTSYLRSYRG